jgi:hypothetical protein
MLDEELTGFAGIIIPHCNEVSVVLGVALRSLATASKMSVEAVCSAAV